MANSASDARYSEADIRHTLIENNLIYGMVTLPSNMFWTVTLPATLWFFDKGKKDDRILFIDARNIFTQIDRAHRAFSPEQVSNIGVISHLHKGNRAAFVQLIDDYFAQGLGRLAENAAQEAVVAGQLLAVLDDAEGKTAVDTLTSHWAGWRDLQAAYEAYVAQGDGFTSIEAHNEAQHQLRALFDPFFAGLQAGLKTLDKTVRQYEKQSREANGRRGLSRDLKELKAALETIRAEVKDAESFFAHIHWLQERFPQAAYEDVTGLCKLATLAEIREQDYSLNPGRYVGVVIEEDGKTEEEFVAELLDLQDQLEKLNSEAHTLEKVISYNLIQLVGDL